jgi:hypothetical protein
MSKSDKVNKTAGAAASRSKSAQKVLDIERRFIDDPIQQGCPTFEAKAISGRPLFLLPVLELAALVDR